jgi:hypothetical protein
VDGGPVGKPNLTPMLRGVFASLTIIFSHKTTGKEWRFSLESSQLKQAVSGLESISTINTVKYCTISFNSARAVTRDQKYRFGTSATNEFRRDNSDKIRHSRQKISKILPFLHLQGRFGTFGTGRRDP